MNILFVYTGPIIPQNGGVQRVTDVLSKYFQENGNFVIYLSTNGQSSKYPGSSIQFYLPNHKNLYSQENIDFYINLITTNSIDIIINQAALGGNLVKFCSSIRAHSRVKIISVIHNSLLGNVINFTSSHSNQINKLSIPFLLKLLETNLFKSILKTIYILKYKSAYTYTCKNSDKIVLLSSSYFEELKTFVPNYDVSKVSAIPNPLTIKSDENIISKRNEILYVGRIDTAQKKVDTLLQIWGKLFSKFPDWNLSILGDGPAKNALEIKAREMGLERIEFCGIQDPLRYYKRSKILAMTSAYEGFPLVLAEAQNFGVVPIAFNSFAAVIDIIENDKNGYLIEPFNIELYTSILFSLMNNDKKIKKIASNCIVSADRFSLHSVGKSWLKLFSDLKPIDVVE